MAPKSRSASAAVAGIDQQPTAPPNPQPTNGVLVDHTTAPGGPAINKKKQKRRQKEAQKAASQQQETGNDSIDNPPVSNGHARQDPASDMTATPNMAYQDPNFSHDQYGRDAREYEYSDDDNGYDYDPTYLASDGNKSKKKKKKGKPNNTADANSMTYKSPDSLSYSRLPPPSISNDALRSVSHKIRNPMWETNSAEERRNIKNFWLNLPEIERRKLVNIEKSHVLQKMKEQQKHSCSCTVCGRKRTAIEEELEVLYDAFHVDLENLVTWKLNQLSDPEASRLQDPRIWADPTTNPPLPSSLPPRQPPRGRVTEIADPSDGHEEVDDEEYSDEYDDDEDYSSDEADGMHSHDRPPHFAADFFQFGNSLTVKDGILTVADDLLKNDGQKFIDMMEQLAERRMQREEDARFGGHAYHGQPGMHSHSHAAPLPPEEEEYEDEEDPDEYSDEEEYEEEEDEMDGLTEDQRMEEGRRMFQIFAARMFEQRVVHAYKEQVAWERQQALMAEEEDNGEGPSEAKKAKAAEKKKRQREKAREAKAQKEAQKEEDRLRKESAIREAEEKKKEEQRLKQEEARKRKDAEREAQLEKKRKAEAETHKRREAERERQFEQERKAKELKAEEKRKKEEVDRKKREDKEARDKQAREKKTQEEKDRQDREAKSQSQASIQSMAGSLSRPRSKDGPRPEAPASDSQKRPSLPAAAVVLPPSLRSRPSQTESPQLKIATPALPKAPTPVRQKDSSSREPSTTHTPEKTPISKDSTLSPRATPSQPIQPPNMPSFRTANQHVFSQPQPLSPTHSIHAPPGMTQQNMPIGGMMPMGGYPGPGRSGMMHHGAPGQQMPMYSQMQHQPRPFAPNMPPGMLPPSMQQQQARGFIPEASPAFGQQMPVSSPMMSQPTPTTSRDTYAPPHSRQPSTQIDSPSSDTQPSSVATGPIARPAPIGRPGSTRPTDDRVRSMNADVDDLSKHLGSSALLGDNDEPLEVAPPDTRRASAAPGPPPPANQGFGGSPYDQPYSPFNSQPRSGHSETWGRQTFAPPPMGLVGQPIWGQPSAGAPSWNNTHAQPFSAAPGFNAQTRQVEHQRAQTLRLFTCQSCRVLGRETEEAVKDNKPSINGHSHSLNRDGWFDLTDVADRTNTALRALHIDPPVQPHEVETILSHRGNEANGGGKFLERRDENGRRLVKFIPDTPKLPQGENLGSMAPGFLPHRGGAPGLGLGDIGSPVSERRLPNLGGLGKF